MAQSGYTPISLYYTTTASAVPVNTNLVNGELAINITDGKLYYKDNTGTVKLLASTTGGYAGGSNTQVQYNSSGVLAGSSAFTWDGTSLSATNYVATGTITGSSAKGVYSYGTLGYSDVNHILTMQASVNSYTQMEIQNTNTGAAASADVVVGNNNTTASTYYGDFGMNSSGWTGTAGTNSFGAPNMVYLTATTGDLLLGTTTANAIRFAVGGGADAMKVDGTTSIVSFPTNNAITIPVGSTAQQPGQSGQPAAATGMLRFNSSTTQFEGYNGSTWASVGGAAISNDTTTSTYEYPLFASATSGTALTVYTSNAKYLYKPSTGDLQASQVIAGNGFFANPNTLVTSYTLPASYNASTTGPFTIPSGLSVTVSSGARWVVL